MLLETSKGFSVPIKVRTGIPCSLNKVPNLPSAFSPPSLIVEGVHRISFSVYLHSSLSSVSNSSLPAQLMSGFVVRRPTHTGSLDCPLFPHSCAFMCFSLPVSLPLPTFRTHLKNFCILRAPWLHSPLNPSGPFWSLSCVFLPSG